MTKAQVVFDKPWKHFVAAVISLLLAYAAASWSIDSGRLWAYFITIVFLVLGVKHLVKAIRKGK